MRRNPFFLGGLLCLGWIILNVAMVGAAWLRSYYAPIAPQVERLSLDLRQDKARAGQVITIVATKPTPAKGNYIGHLWLAWPQTPPMAKPGTRESGYYAYDQNQAIMAMINALILPWGVVTGQDFVPGLLKADDGWAHDIELAVRVDEARYQAALTVDRRWRRETRYRLRPAMIGPDKGKTYACQDYVLDVAVALGLKASDRTWTEFPMGAFLRFAHQNGLHPNQGQGQ